MTSTKLIEDIEKKPMRYNFKVNISLDNENNAKVLIKDLEDCLHLIKANSGFEGWLKDLIEIIKNGN
jgi:hypothetical protein